MNSYKYSIVFLLLHYFSSVEGHYQHSVYTHLFEIMRTLSVVSAENSSPSNNNLPT